MLTFNEYYKIIEILSLHKNEAEKGEKLTFSKTDTYYCGEFQNTVPVQISAICDHVWQISSIFSVSFKNTLL